MDIENGSFKSEHESEEGENSNDLSRKLNKNIWSIDNNTAKLIEAWKKCRVLWDSKHPLYRDKMTRHAKQEFLADMFCTTVEEINRKLHNLRSQFNKEVRKLKKYRRLVEGSMDESPVTTGGISWEYFDALSTFLMPESFAVDPLEQIESVNISLAEFQANEEDEFGAAARQRKAATNTLSDSNQAPRRVRTTPRVAASETPMIPPHPMVWAEEPQPKIRPGGNTDECQIFGDFVASELRTLRSDESRKRLKRLIQKAILQVDEEEDDSACG